MKMSFRVVAAIVLAVSLGVSTYGQFSFSSLGPGGAYNQNFNGLTTGTVPVQDNVSFLGVYSFRTLNDAPPNLFVADTGASNTDEFKNYGLNLDTDRCFGSLAGNDTGDMFYGIRFQNDTATTI